jgi:hypothetical protein
MTTLSKAFLIASIASFVLGLTGPGGDIAWGLLYPMTAVLFILFFVTNLLATEVAKFNEEHTADLAFVASLDRRSASKSTSRSAERTNKSTAFAEAMAT